MFHVARLFHSTSICKCLVEDHQRSVQKNVIVCQSPLSATHTTDLVRDLVMGLMGSSPSTPTSNLNQVPQSETLTRYLNQHP